MVWFGLVISWEKQAYCGEFCIANLQRNEQKIILVVSTVVLQNRLRVDSVYIWIKVQKTATKANFMHFNMMQQIFFLGRCSYSIIF